MRTWQAHGLRPQGGVFRPYSNQARYGRFGEKLTFNPTDHFDIQAIYNLLAGEHHPTIKITIQLDDLTVPGHSGRQIAGVVGNAINALREAK